MADLDNPHFNKIFYFIVYSFTMVLLLALAVIFIPIPDKNFTLANTVVIFFLGTVVGGGIGYLLGGNPIQKEIKSPSSIATDKVNVDADKVNVNEKQ